MEPWPAGDEEQGVTEATYDVRVFQGLNTEHDAVKSLARQRACLTELGATICAHQLHELIGVSLLHRHFDLQPNERLVREWRGSSFCTEPQTWDRREHLTPYLWKLEADCSTRWKWYPLEFVSESGAGRHVDAQGRLLMRHRQFLSAFSRSLVEMSATDTFGIAILFEQMLRLSKDEFM